MCHVYTQYAKLGLMNYKPVLLQSLVQSSTEEKFPASLKPEEKRVQLCKTQKQM